LNASCDNILRVYLDGVLAFGPETDLWKAHTVPVPASTRVIGISCYDEGGAYGIVASADNGRIVTDDSWSCSSKELSGWATIGFDDKGGDFLTPSRGNIYNQGSHWTSQPPVGIDQNAHSLWGPTEHGWAFCRKILEAIQQTSTTPAPVMTNITGAPAVFIKPGEFAITKNNKLGEISLGRQYIITFQLFITAPLPADTPHVFGSVLHLTIGGNDHDVYGDRTPALWIYGGSTKLLLQTAINGHTLNSQSYINAISINTWIHMEISQLDNGSEIVFSMKVNGETVASHVNSDARAFPNVIIYGGNPFGYEAALGKMKDLEIRSIA